MNRPSLFEAAPRARVETLAEFEALLTSLRSKRGDSELVHLERLPERPAVYGEIVVDGNGHRSGAIRAALPLKHRYHSRH